MKRSKVIFQEKLVAGFWKLIPMESGDELLSTQDTSTVRVAEDRLSEKKHSNYWLIEDNFPSLKKYLVNSQYPAVRGICYEACLELRFDTVHKQTVFNVLQRIVRKLITYENDVPTKNRELLLERWVNYVDDIIVKTDTTKLGMSKKEVIQVI